MCSWNPHHQQASLTSASDACCSCLNSRSADLLGLQLGPLGFSRHPPSTDRLQSPHEQHRLGPSGSALDSHVCHGVCGLHTLTTDRLGGGSLDSLVGPSVFSSRVSSRFRVKSQGNRLNSRSARKTFSTTSTGGGFAVGCVLRRNGVGRRRRSPRARARLHACAPTHIELASIRTLPP